MQIRKNKKANLESKKSIFLQIGFIISLAFVLVAFEWTTVETEKFDWNFDRGILVDEDIYEVKIIKEIPEPKKMKIVPPIFVPDDEDFIDDENLFDPEVTEETENSLDNQKEFYVEEIEEEDNTIYKYVEQWPEFPGGEAALFQYLRDNLKYPKLAKDIHLTGTVHVSFIVWKDGTIRNVNILRGIGSGCDEEVIRVIKKMPTWNPGIQGGQKVNVSFHIPVSFKLR